MGLFDMFKNSPKPPKDDSTNDMYDLLFCDNLDLYKSLNRQPDVYPWDILFSDTTTQADLQKLIDDQSLESRIKLLAYHRLRANGYQSDRKDLLAVIVEVGLDQGNDVLASFHDGTARYINQTGKILIWETTDNISNALTYQLFEESTRVVKQIGPWDQARRPPPARGMVRITFLVSEGLYFGEGPLNELFNDPLAAPALAAATALMKYITEKALPK